jgi:DNA-3-methyladenine glycosylase
MGPILPLPRSFFEPSAEFVAPALLGHWLLRRTPQGWCGGPIVETEAYLRDDPACHGARGQTTRNQVMFGPPGYSYVYFIYGCHFCVNAVCGPAGTAEAVLIRAIEPQLGELQMRRRRPATRPQHLTNGPAKLCQALAIDRGLDGADLCNPDSPLLIGGNPAPDQWRHDHGPVVTTTRIGITKAASSLLRFYFQRSPFVSHLNFPRS